MAEFTGERVVPGEVDPNLWNEHFARYAYAAQFASGKRVADLGCGTGYGTAELARTATLAVGVDVSAEAAAYAQAQYPAAHYLAGSAEQVPFANGTFDLITSFEVIEHLEQWPHLLDEARRLLAPDGLFLVSTPNKSYYAESRAEHGANPFHVHEFEYEEFADALRRLFPHTAVLVENHAEGIAISSGAETAEWRVTSEAHAQPANAHFYLAVASAAPLPPLPSFVYLPTTGNLLQEREHHIHKLASEIGKKDRWIGEYTAERAKLLAEHEEMIEIYRRQQTEMEQQARWTQQVNEDLTAALQRIGQLQDEMAIEQQAALAMAQGYEVKIAELELDSRRIANWATETEERLTAALRQQQEQLEAKCQELALCVEYLHNAERDLDERTAWAQSLQAEAGKLQEQVRHTTAQLDFVRSSRWVKVGRRLGVGPAV